MKQIRQFPYVEFEIENARKLINRMEEVDGKMVEVKVEVEEPEVFRLNLADNVGTTCHVKPESISNIKRSTGARVIGYGNFPDRKDYNDLRSYLETECRFELEHARREQAERQIADRGVPGKGEGASSKKHLGAQA